MSIATPSLEKVMLQAIRGPSSLLQFYCSFNQFVYFYIFFKAKAGGGKNQTRTGAIHMGFMLVKSS